MSDKIDEDEEERLLKLLINVKTTEDMEEWMKFTEGKISSNPVKSFATLEEAKQDALDKDYGNDDEGKES